MTHADYNGIGTPTGARVYLSEEQKQALITDAQIQLVRRLKTLIECLSDFGFGRGQVLLAVMETNFIEYGKTVLAGVAQIVHGADADLCLITLRRQIIPEVITSILPRANLMAGTEPVNSLPLSPDGLWEQLLDRAYATAGTTSPSGQAQEMDASAFRTQYTFRLRRERFRNAFKQKLEAALTAVIREVGRGVRQRLSPTISEIRAQARQRRRSQVGSEQQVFSDPQLFNRDWSNDLSEICRAFEGRVGIPEAWRTRKSINTWREVSAMIETDRAFRSRVRKYIRRRLCGLRAIATAERAERAG